MADPRGTIAGDLIGASTVAFGNTLHEGISSGSIVMGGAAVASIRVPGSSAGGLVLGGSAIANLRIAGVSTGSFLMGGAAIGNLRISGESSGGFALDGTADGVVRINAVSIGEITFTGSANLNVRNHGAGSSGSIDFSGNANLGYRVQYDAPKIRIMSILSEPRLIIVPADAAAQSRVVTIPLEMRRLVIANENRIVRVDPDKDIPIPFERRAA